MKARRRPMETPVATVPLCMIPSLEPGAAPLHAHSKPIRAPTRHWFRGAGRTEHGGDSQEGGKTGSTDQINFGFSGFPDFLWICPARAIWAGLAEELLERFQVGAGLLDFGVEDQRQAGRGRCLLGLWELPAFDLRRAGTFSIPGRPCPPSNSDRGHFARSARCAAPPRCACRSCTAWLFERLVVAMLERGALGIDRDRELLGSRGRARGRCCSRRTRAPARKRPPRSARCRVATVVVVASTEETRTEERRIAAAVRTAVFIIPCALPKKPAPGPPKNPDPAVRWRAKQAGSEQRGRATTAGSGPEQARHRAAGSAHVRGCTSVAAARSPPVPKPE